MPQLSPLPWLLYFMMSFTILVFACLVSESLLGKVSAAKENNLKMLTIGW